MKSFKVLSVTILFLFVFGLPAQTPPSKTGTAGVTEEQKDEKAKTPDNEKKTETPVTTTTPTATGKEYTMATGFRGGTYFKIGKSLKEKGILNVNAIPSSGSIQNIKMIRDHQADFAIAQLDILVNFALRRDSIKKNVKIVLPVYREELHIIARKNYYQLDELEEGTISLGPRSSGTYGTGRIVLNALGLDESLVYLDYSDPNYALSLLKNGKLDAMFVVAGAPVNILSRLKENFADKFKMLDVSEDLYETLTKQHLPYVMTTVPEGTYPWLKKDVQTLAVGSAIIARADIPDDVIEKLIQDIFSRQSELAEAHPKWKELDKSGVQSFTTVRKHFMHPAAIETIKSLK